MLLIDTVFFLIEVGVGLAVGSLALMADAFHMLNDIISLVIGLWAVRMSAKPSTDEFSFGVGYVFSKFNCCLLTSPVQTIRNSRRLL